MSDVAALVYLPEVSVGQHQDGAEQVLHSVSLRLTPRESPFQDSVQDSILVNPSHSHPAAGSQG